MAAFTVRKPTPYLRCKARFDNPARASRRIAAYRSTLDFNGTGAPTPRRAPPESHRKHPSGIKLSDITLRQHRTVSPPIDNRCQHSLKFFNEMIS
jgi:hypothetical protein